MLYCIVMLGGMLAMNKLIKLLSLMVITCSLSSCATKNSNLLSAGKLVNYQDCPLPLWQEWRVSLETDTLQSAKKNIKLEYGHMEWEYQYNEILSADNSQEVNLSLIRKIYNEDNETTQKILSLDEQLGNIMSNKYAFGLEKDSDDRESTIVFNQELLIDEVFIEDFSIGDTGRIAYGLVLSTIDGQALSFLDTTLDIYGNPYSFVGGYYTVSIGYEINNGKITFSDARSTLNEIW